MALNPTGEARIPSWNYTDPGKPGFSLELVGTVVAIQEVQAMNFGRDRKPTTPKFWDDGNPVWNIRITFAGPNGGCRSWTFAPAGKEAREGKKPHVHMKLFALTGNTDMMNLIGKTLKVSTEAPPSGFSYGIGNPRPWEVELLDDATLTPPGPWSPAEPLPKEYSLPKKYADAAVSGGQVQAAPATTPMQPVSSVQPAVPGSNPYQQAAPAVPAQPVPGVPDSVYDEDIPF